MAVYKNDKVKVFLNELEEVKQIKTEEALQKYFEGLAKILFNQIDILAGNERYSFAELEFYYFKNGVFDSEQYQVTYPRTKNAGRLFWHLSGIDICFESDIETGYYGGILIRSIVKEDGSLITGPMCCSDELLNSCVECRRDDIPATIPMLVDKETQPNIELKTTIRQGIEADKDDWEFCFYSKRDSWTNYKRNYYSARPDKRKK